jgi:DNA-binding response OmpR family regulator
LLAANAGTEWAPFTGPGSGPKPFWKAGAALPRLLVVEDEANQTRGLAIGLRIEGFDTHVARSAEAALEALAVEPFDLALVDLMLPGTNGIQLARMIRDRHPRVRVALTSAYHLSERQLLRADCGAVGFVPKPFDLTELARFLRSKLQAGVDDRPFVSRGAAA